MTEGQYRRLSVRPIINAAGNDSLLGGSVPAGSVLAAMDDAARALVDIPSLQRAVHARLAEVTRNEAAYVTCGAAAGIYLATAAAVSRHYGTAIDRLDRRQIGSAQVLVPAGCRNQYDVAVRQVGVELIEVAGDAAVLGERIGPDTVAVLHAPGGWNPRGTPSVDDVAAVTRTAHIPLIADAAAQLPPIANVWGFTGRGADVAIFSGGKSLAGPQSSGLLVGSSEFLQWVEAIGYPHDGFGRILKVGREELVGLLVAVELALTSDEPARRQWCEEQVRTMVAAFADHPLLTVTRAFPNISGQPLPYAAVRPRSPDVDTDRLAMSLREGDPSIAVGPIPGSQALTDGFIVNPLALREGQTPLIVAALRTAADDMSNTATSKE